MLENGGEGQGWLNQKGYKSSVVGLGWITPLRRRSQRAWMKHCHEVFEALTQGSFMDQC